eukprot:CAMPEP_0181228596 /NCGR_PEP_ID=MMETSP1096-20121128/33432_1 /TAXON_ID=156174 ORGANISM="Chrysochromulina ericina, Strain CCMP281" /NCGR_SAMPLE_ID=MMETSP1096 /ASSEMBLY_ACC=CAM_ASM_000453 /LENGTH=165 /DNA_ID=CAMNT_0023322131 /DNA_START=26 /DNA_END=521 /DNA_ORIENTATION=+
MNGGGAATAAAKEPSAEGPPEVLIDDADDADRATGGEGGEVGTYVAAKGHAASAEQRLKATAAVEEAAEVAWEASAVASETRAAAKRQLAEVEELLAGDVIGYENEIEEFEAEIETVANTPGDVLHGVTLPAGGVLDVSVGGCPAVGGWPGAKGKDDGEVEEATE